MKWEFKYKGLVACLLISSAVQMKIKPLWSTDLLIISLCSLCSAKRRSAHVKSPTFQYEIPTYFKFGVSSTAYQTEGAWNITGKSESIWDVYSHRLGKIKNNETGDDSCKSYEHFERDHAMLGFLQVDFYRLSISWPRILPDGFSHKISKSGIEHYHAILDDLQMNSIDPMVIMYNNDLPQVLQDLGGWTNPKMIEWVTDYARVLFQNFGHKVNCWITFNKPQQIGMGYSSDHFAPGVKAHGIGEYLVAKHIVLAHASIWHLYRDEFKSSHNGFVGFALDINFYQGLTEAPEDLEAALDAMEFEVGLYAHPLLAKAGGFPLRVEKIVANKSAEQGFYASRLSPLSALEIDMCKGSHADCGAIDFLGFNHFTTKTVSRKNYVPGKFIPSMEDDLGVNVSSLNVKNQSIAVNPYGIRKALNWVRDNYNNPAVVIFENGLATNGSLLDTDRIDYFKKYLKNVLDAIKEDNVNVAGYAAWSLMDSFEWDAGYTPKYGIFSVDFNDTDRKRSARLSALWYRNLLDTRVLDPDYEPTFEDLVF